MAILQALLALIGRSAGKILNAVFGWAVRALFGFTSGMEQTLLTILVAMAALWPLLLVGVAWPRVAAFALAFVPVPESVPDGAIRAGWAGLALLLPGIVGLALAAKAPPGGPRESALVRAARGYPTTLGLAIAFWISIVTVPVLRLVSLVRREQDVYVPLVTSEAVYAPVARTVRDVLNARGHALVETEPAWWVALPLGVLRALGGRALRGYVPRRLAHLRGPELEAALYPSGLLLRGREERTTAARGLVLEALTACDAFQTTTAEAQALERKIHRVWSVLAEQPAHVGSRALASRLAEIGEEIALLEAPHEDWQVVYRQALQLSRAIHGEPPLLESASGALRHPIESGGTDMATYVDEAVTAPGAPPTGAPEQLSTVALVREITAKASELVRKEVALARAELREDVRSELGMVKLVGAAGVLGIVMLSMLAMAGVFALSTRMDAWAAALVVAGALALVAALLAVLGWRKHVRKPLGRTRTTLEQNVEWAKERMA